VWPSATLPLNLENLNFTARLEGTESKNHGLKKKNKAQTKTRTTRC
jgi:hypothetical protein